MSDDIPDINTEYRVDPISNIAMRATDHDAECFANLLRLLTVPEPDCNSFYYGNEADFLFADPLGLALRIGYRESMEGMDIQPSTSHDLIIQPWRSCNLQECTIEIVPIADLGETRNNLNSDIAFLGDELSKSSLDFWDIYKPDNIGYLPVFKDRFSEHGLPIVIDRGAVMPTVPAEGAKTGVTKTFEESAFYRHIQERVYKPFLDTLQRVWPEGSSISSLTHRNLCEFVLQCNKNRTLEEGNPEKILFGLKSIEDYGSSRNRSKEALVAARNYLSETDEVLDECRKIFLVEP